MSQVAISGNASGTGVFTIAAPNSNVSYTATLAAGTGTVVLDTLAQTLTNKTLTSPTITGAVVSSMASSVITSSTAQNTTSGTSIDFTSIPSWVKRITVMLNGVSTNGTSQLLVQIGSGSVTTTGYQTTAVGFSTSALAAFTNATGFVLANAGSAAYARYGNLVITNVSGNIWNANGMFIESQSLGYTAQTTGNVTLGGTLDRVRLTTLNGTDAFDAGSVNILYE